MKNWILLPSVVAAALLAFPVFVSAQGATPSAQETARISPTDAAPSAPVGSFSCPNGGPVLIHQPPNQSNGLFADSDCGGCGTGQQSLADDFVLGDPTTVAQIVLWGGYFPGNQIPISPDAIDVIFHQDAGGLPDAVIDSQNVVPTSATLTGVVLFGVNEVLYVVDISPVALPAGTLWVEMFTNSVGNSDSFFWEAGDLDPVNGRLNNAFAQQTPGVTWLTGNPVTDLAFALCGSGDTEVFTPVALEVDYAELASDGNDVFEPGELVEVAPAWIHGGTITHDMHGMATNFTGPAGPVYDLVLDAAEYGLVDPGEGMSCRDSGVCYQMGVGPKGVERPGLHWDATFDETLSEDSAHTWTLHLGDSFADVARTSGFYPSVETLLHHGITGGCSATQYCPAGINTRAQMPVFVLRALEGADYVPPACEEGSEVFGDVPFSHTFCPWIEELANRGVVSGCGGGNYCLGNPVTRGQMAIFLLKTLEGSEYTPPPCTGVFVDVACPSSFADWIEDLYSRGITGGCTSKPLGYCPANPVNRQQMAIFVSRTFGLVLYGP